MTPRQILTGKNVTEDRNLGTITYNILCKWENQAEKVEMRLGQNGRTRVYAGLLGYK
jgi:hypothetical protein